MTFDLIAFEYKITSFKYFYEYWVLSKCTAIQEC